METITRAYEFAFYPSKSQKRMLANWFGGTRAIYNIMLNEQITNYNDWLALTEAKRGKSPYPSYVAMSARLTEMKATTHPWLNETLSVALQESLKTLECSFKNFFSKRTSFPRFKSRDNRQTLSLTYRGFGWDEQTKGLRLARKSLRLRGGRTLPNRPLRITIVKEVTGKYYVKAICAIPRPTAQTTKTDSIGLDMGIKDLVTDSNGQTVKVLPLLKPLYADLKVKQRRHAKVVDQMKKIQCPDKRNLMRSLREKHRKIVARVYAKINNVRKDALHKITRRLVDTYAVIGIEGLRITDMVRMAKKDAKLKYNLPRLILQSCWGEFFRQLTYKADGSRTTRIMVMDTAFPSTQIHHTCGVRAKTKIPLSHRVWHCSTCHVPVDRDHNAALNIRAASDYMTQTLKNVKETVVIANVKTAVWI